MKLGLGFGDFPLSELSDRRSLVVFSRTEEEEDGGGRRRRRTEGSPDLLHLYVSCSVVGKLRNVESA